MVNINPAALGTAAFPSTGSAVASNGLGANHTARYSPHAQSVQSQFNRDDNLNFSYDEATQWLTTMMSTSSLYNTPVNQFDQASNVVQRFIQTQLDGDGNGEITTGELAATMQAGDQQANLVYGGEDNGALESAELFGLLGTVADQYLQEQLQPLNNTQALERLADQGYSIMHEDPALSFNLGQMTRTGENLIPGEQMPARGIEDQGFQSYFAAQAYDNYTKVLGQQTGADLFAQHLAEGSLGHIFLGEEGNDLVRQSAVASPLPPTTPGQPPLYNFQYTVNITPLTPNADGSFTVDAANTQIEEGSLTGEYPVSTNPLTTPQQQQAYIKTLMEGKPEILEQAITPERVKALNQTLLNWLETNDTEQLQAAVQNLYAEALPAYNLPDLPLEFVDETSPVLAEYRHGTSKTDNGKFVMNMQSLSSEVESLRLSGMDNTAIANEMTKRLFTMVHHEIAHYDLMTFANREPEALQQASPQRQAAQQLHDEAGNTAITANFGYLVGNSRTAYDTNLPELPAQGPGGMEDLVGQRLSELGYH